MQNYRVSIITPCYNSEKTIAKTVESVLYQTSPIAEYIIIDGASTDRTLEIVQSYEKDFGGRLQIISEPDTGIYNAMNKGIKQATGDIIGIVNSDDYYELDAVEKVLAHYDGYPYAILYGMLRMIKAGKEVSVYIKNAEFLPDDMIAHPSCFVTKAIYDEFGVYNEAYRYSADYEFMLRMYENDKVKFLEMYDILSNFSIDGASGSAKAYLETITLRYEKGLMGKKEYSIKSLKTKIALLLRK